MCNVTDLSAITAVLIQITHQLKPTQCLGAFTWSVALALLRFIWFLQSQQPGAGFLKQAPYFSLGAHAKG